MAQPRPTRPAQPGLTPRPLPGPRPSGGPVPRVADARVSGPPLPPRPPVQRALPARPHPVDVLEARSPRNRPDPNPLRLLIAFAGLASASAVVTAMLPSVVPAASLDAPFGGVLGPQPTVVHVTHYVTLQPGQTAPPNAPVVVQPTPQPVIHVVTRTRQSGVP